MNNLCLLLILLSIPFILITVSNVKSIISKKEESKLFFNELMSYSVKLIKKTVYVTLFILINLFLLSFLIKSLDFSYFLSNYIVEIIIVSWTLSFFYQDSSNEVHSKMIEVDKN